MTLSIALRARRLGERATEAESRAALPARPAEPGTAAGCEDRELIARVQRDRDQQAMAELYDRFSRPVYGLILSILREPKAAEDVTQDVFLTFWNQPGAYIAERGAFGPWLLRVSRNRAIDHIRRRGREVAPDPERESIFDLLPDGERDVEDQVWDRDLARKVRAALAELSAPQREVVQLAYFGGMSQSEMAAALGIPLGTIKTRMRTALRRLAELMEHER